MGFYCLVELGSLWVIATLWNLDCVKWTLLPWASQFLFKVLTCDILPWVLKEKPLILNYWYFLPFRRTLILSYASLPTHCSPREVKWLLCYFEFGTDPQVSQLLYSVKLPACREQVLWFSPSQIGLEVKALSNWQITWRLSAWPCLGRLSA